MDSLDDNVGDDLNVQIIELDQRSQDHKKRFKAKKTQMNKLNAFMKDRSESWSDKEINKEEWKNLVRELNDLGPPIFTDSQWKLKWSQHKYNKKRKLTEESHEPIDESVVARTVSPSDILQKLNKILAKQDVIIEKLDNKLLKQIAERLFK